MDTQKFNFSVYTYGSGEHGCLYDNGPNFAVSEADASVRTAYSHPA